MWFTGLVGNKLQDTWTHKVWSIPTMFGIAWGVASMIFLMAIGDGFKSGRRRSL